MYTYSIPINYTAELLNMTYYPDSCGIYLAPSSIPNAGFGLYAGRDFRKGEILVRTQRIILSSVLIPMCFVLASMYANETSE